VTSFLIKFNQRLFYQIEITLLDTRERKKRKKR